MMRWIPRAGAAVAALSTLAFGPAAHAEGVDIDHVESTDGRISIVVGVDGLPVGTEVQSDAWEVLVNGEKVETDAQAIDAGEIERTTVIALDASRSMAGAPFQQALAAAGAFLEAAPPDVAIGLVTFADEVTQVSAPTTDRSALSEALDGIELALGTHLYDGVVDAVELAGDDGSRSVVVLSDGKDTGSSSSLEDATLIATESGVVVDVVALAQAPAQRALLDEVADSSGGQVIDASSPEALTQVFEQQADALAQQVLLQFDQPAGADGDTDLAVSLVTPGETFTDSALVSLAPSTGASPKDVDSSGSGVSSSVLLAGALALGIGLAAILAVLFLGERGPSRAEQKITEYFGSADPGSTHADNRGSAPTQSSLRGSAVAISERMVKGRDLESRLNTRLSGGGSALTPAEWLLLHTGFAIFAGFAGLILVGGAGMLVGLIAGIVLPWQYLRFKHNRRLAAFNAQLAEMLDLISGGLSAGLSMPQAVDTVVREGQEPMVSELRRALIEQRLGVSIEDALEGVATRMDSQDFAWVVMAIRIQREVGGNLAELLRTVSDTLREREYLRRQVKVLSAEGRFSGWVLGGLPIFLFCYMLMFRPEYVEVLYTTTVGLLMMLAAIVLLIGGFWTMSRIVKIEV